MLKMRLNPSTGSALGDRQKDKGLFDIAPFYDAQYRFTTLEDAADWHWV